MKTRSQHKIKMKPCESMACIIIQRNFRKYLNNRYKHLRNNQDIDVITQTPIKLISKNKIFDLDNYGCDGTQLIEWMNKSYFKTTPIYPQNQKPLTNENVMKCIEFGKKYSNKISNKDDRLEFKMKLFSIVNKLILCISEDI